MGVQEYWGRVQEYWGRVQEYWGRVQKYLVAVEGLSANPTTNPSPVPTANPDHAPYPPPCILGVESSPVPTANPDHNLARPGDRQHTHQRSDWLSLGLGFGLGKYGLG